MLSVSTCTYVRVAPRSAPRRLQGGAQATGLTLAAMVKDDVNGGDAQPPGAVGCRRHGAPSHCATSHLDENHFAVDHRGQHLRGNAAPVQSQPGVVRVGQQPGVRAGQKLPASPVFPEVRSPPSPWCS